MVGIVAAMGGEVEGDGEALLAGGEVAAVEGVGILGRGEAGILADRPGLVDVHGRIGAAQERRQARKGVEEVEPGQVAGAVDATSPECPPASSRARRTVPERARPEQVRRRWW